MVPNNIKQLEVDKVVVKTTYSKPFIDRWLKPKGYELRFVGITCHTFHLTLNLVYSSFSEFKRFIKNMHDFDCKEKDLVACVLLLEDKGVSWVYMLIQENEWTPEAYNTIVHELHHVVHFGLVDKGLKYNEASEETFAYVQGYFMEMIVRAFVQLKKSEKKLTLRKR